MQLRQTAARKLEGSSMTLTRRNLLAGMGAALPTLAAQGWGIQIFSRRALPFSLAARDAETSTGPVLLNSNENPYGPFPSVLAMRDPFSGANRYPDHRSEAIRNLLASQAKVSDDRVVTGCGSTEILRMAANAFCGPRKNLVTASPTFEALGHYAETVGARTTKVPLTSKYAHDLEAMAAAASSSTGLIYICNPNNPTASITPRAEIEAFLRKLPNSTYVLLDEAYHDFAMGQPGYVSFIEQPVDDPRLIVARTFSKIYGLAGMRLGYAVAAKPTAELLRNQKLEDDLNALVIRCGLTSLQDSAGHKQARERNARDRDEFVRLAQARKLACIPSYTNFVMMQTDQPIRSVIGHFRKNGIEIGRPFPPMDTYARISLGTPEQMKTFWQTWDRMNAASLATAHQLVAEDFQWRGGVC
jgi:histidinol-phosphate aminotransferase